MILPVRHRGWTGGGGSGGHGGNVEGDEELEGAILLPDVRVLLCPLPLGERVSLHEDVDLLGRMLEQFRGDLRLLAC